MLITQKKFHLVVQIRKILRTCSIFRIMGKVMTGDKGSWNTRISLAGAGIRKEWPTVNIMHIMQCNKNAQQLPLWKRQHCVVQVPQAADSASWIMFQLLHQTIQRSAVLNASQSRKWLQKMQLYGQRPCYLDHALWHSLRVRKYPRGNLTYGICDKWINHNLFSCFSVAVWFYLHWRMVWMVTSIA